MEETGRAQLHGNVVLGNAVAAVVGKQIKGICEPKLTFTRTTNRPELRMKVMIRDILNALSTEGGCVVMVIIVLTVREDQVDYRDNV